MHIEFVRFYGDKLPLNAKKSTFFKDSPFRTKNFEPSNLEYSNLVLDSRFFLSKITVMLFWVLFSLSVSTMKFVRTKNLGNMNPYFWWIASAISKIGSIRIICSLFEYWLIAEIAPMPRPTRICGALPFTWAAHSAICLASYAKVSSLGVPLFWAEPR